MKLPVVLAVVAALAEGTGAVAQPARAVVQWAAHVAEADDLTPQTRSYRLFQSPERVSILLIFTNFSAFGVTIDTQRFRDLVRVKVRAGAEVPVETQWEWTLRRSGESYSTDVPEHVDLEAGAGFAWAFTVRQTSGEVFFALAYVGAGEDGKAAQLLESNGLPAARTPEAIRELRRLVAQRVKR